MALLLDEMFAPVIARTLREHGHDVIAVADEPELRGLSDQELLSWASRGGRWIVTENVRDFQPLRRLADAAARPSSGVLFTSPRAFPRSRRNPGPLIAALADWLDRSGSPEQGTEQWLPGPADSTAHA